MKKLVIIRHSKSDKSENSIDDYDRPLNNKGLNDAKLIGEYLFEKMLKPDMILSSPSLRTMTTAEIIAKEVKYEKVIIPNQYIYEAFVNTLQDIVNFIHDENNTVFLIGHNPGVSALSYMMCGLKKSIPTSAVVEIDFDCDSWMEVSRENGTLISYSFK